MNEVMNLTQMQTPIEIALGIDENGMTTARRLYEFLELRPGNFARWCRVNIKENQFAEENEDYLRLFFEEETPTGGKIQREDFKLTANFAKKLSMTQKNHKGEAAREYFTRVEDGAKKMIMQIQELSPELQAIFLHDKKIRQVETKVKAINEDLQQFKKNLPLLPAEAESVINAINKLAVRLLGGKESNAYKNSSLRGKLYWDIHRELKRQFGVTKYKYIKSCQCGTAVNIIEAYQPPLILAEQIADCNAQIDMEVA